MAKPRLTLAEQERILEETLSLIKEPATWTTGKWKCNLYEVDKNGDFVHDADGQVTRATDHNNRPLSQYCIEGALNQATYNVVGKERAIDLGAIRVGTDPEKFDDAFESNETISDPAERLGINKLAFELHEQRILARVEEENGYTGDYDGADAALILNDSFEFEEQAVGHKAIVDLVQTRLGQVRAELDKKEAHAAQELVGQA